GVGVADVHVAVDEPGRHQQVAGVDHAIGARRRQGRRLAHAAHAAALDEDRAVPDDPPLAIHRDDVAGVVDLEALRWHGASYTNRATGPGTGGAASRRR